MFAGHYNYADWHEHNREPLLCEYCKGPFHPPSPTSRHCEDCLPIYRHDVWRESLSPSGFVRLVLGMTPAEYIKEHGQESFDQL